MFFAIFLSIFAKTTKSGAPPIRAFVSKSKTRQKVVRAGSSEDKEKVRFCSEMKNETKRAALLKAIFVKKRKRDKNLYSLVFIYGLN